MERLTKQLNGNNWYDLKEVDGDMCDIFCQDQSLITCKNCAIFAGIQKLASYENSEEQGLLLQLNPETKEELLAQREYAEQVLRYTSLVGNGRLYGFAKSILETLNSLINNLENNKVKKD